MSPPVMCLDALCLTDTCSWMGTATTRSTSHTFPLCRFSRKASPQEVNTTCPQLSRRPASLVTQRHWGRVLGLSVGSLRCLPALLCGL